MRTRTVLPEDPGSGLSTIVGELTTACKSSTRRYPFLISTGLALNTDVVTLYRV